MKRILIFGATGSVGCYTALHLKARGHEIIAVGKRTSDNGFFNDHGIEYYSVDIANSNAFDVILTNGIDAVLHFAGNMPSKMKGYSPENYFGSIIGGTYNVLEYCRRMKVPKIIFTQTRADSNQYMGSKEPVPADIQRTFPVKGDHAIYTICKNAAVDLIQHYTAEYGLKGIIFRLPTIYAFHPDKHFYVNGERRVKAYRYLMEKAEKGEDIEIWGDPSLEKEIVYVKDLSHLICNAVDSDSESGIFNVGNGHGISLEEQIKGIVDVFSSKDNKSEIIYRRDKPDSRQFIHDISKTKQTFNFRPQFTYREMLEDFKEEMNNNRFSKLWGEG